MLVLILRNLVMPGNVTWYDIEVVLDFGLSSIFDEQCLVKDKQPDSETISRKKLPSIEVPRCTDRIKFVPLTEYLMPR